MIAAVVREGSAEIRANGRDGLFIADVARVEHGTVFATGRWRLRRNGGFSYGPTVSRAWAIRAVEVRFTGEVVA